MNKKGLTWGTIVSAIIAIIVLIAIVWIFRKQINEIYKDLTGIIKSVTSGGDEVGKGLEEIIKKNK